MLLRDVAHARSGDKGPTSDLTVVAYDAADYAWLVGWLTPDRVREHFTDLPITSVDRHLVPQLAVLKFVLHDALGGGVTATLNLDPHGKCLSSCLLAMETPERSMLNAHESCLD